MLLNSTKCKCGKEHSETKFDKYTPHHDYNFYGGRVSMTGDVTCECGRELKGYFERNDMGKLKLIDLEITKENTEKNTETKEIIPLENLTYKELQALAKEKGINANLKREEIIEQLAHV